MSSVIMPGRMFLIFYGRKDRLFKIVHLVQIHFPNRNVFCFTLISQIFADHFSFGRLEQWKSENHQNILCELKDKSISKKSFYFISAQRSLCAQ